MVLLGKTALCWHTMVQDFFMLLFLLTSRWGSYIRLYYGTVFIPVSPQGTDGELINWSAAFTIALNLGVIGISSTPDQLHFYVGNSSTEEVRSFLGLPCRIVCHVGISLVEGERMRMWEANWATRTILGSTEDVSNLLNPSKWGPQFGTLHIACCWPFLHPVQLALCLCTLEGAAQRMNGLSQGWIHTFFFFIKGHVLVELCSISKAMSVWSPVCCSCLLLEAHSSVWAARFKCLLRICSPFCFTCNHVCFDVEQVLDGF